MTCELVQRAIVAGEPADAGHLAACSACQAFEAAHRAALDLAAIEPRRAHRVRRAPVMARGALLLALVTASALVVGRRSERTEEPAVALPTTWARGETELTVEAIDHAQEWAALVQLHEGLAADLHRDLSITDHTYSSFGALSQWLAPTSLTVTALED